MTLGIVEGCAATGVVVCCHVTGVQGFLACFAHGTSSVAADSNEALFLFLCFLPCTKKTKKQNILDF